MPNASIASTSKNSLEAQICAAQWFLNEVELEVTEEFSDPDDYFNRTGVNYLESGVSINPDE